MSTRPSTRPVAVRATLLAAASVLVVACGGSVPSSAPAGASATPGAPSATPTSEPPSTAPSPSASPAALILKVSSEGGFINPVATLGALPLVEVYSDGTILTPASVASDPPPLLPAEDVRDVGPDGATAIVAAIRQAGLAKQSDATSGVPGDNGTDVFAVTLDGTTIENRISGNGPGVGRPGGLGGSADPGQAAALDLLNRLVDPSELWGAASAPETAFQPTGYRVFAAPVPPQGDPSTAPKAVAWPLATPLASFGVPANPDRGVQGLRQGAVVGADASTLAPVLAGATIDTGFTSGGQTWTLYVRPLLPDELGA
jgi:hypothetical protein